IWLYVGKKISEWHRTYIEDKIKYELVEYLEFVENKYFEVLKRVCRRKRVEVQEIEGSYHYKMIFGEKGAMKSRKL
ncbi:hypothetical protein Kpol_526p1, partial [Vanderwaltozyma polyspora DSM 70294]